MVALHSRRSFLALAGTATGLASSPGSATRTTDDSPTPATTTDGTSTGRTTTAGTATDDASTDDPPTDGTPTAAPVGDYPTFGGGPARTGHAPDERGPRPPVASRWCVGAGGANRLTPLAVVDGTVFSGNPATGLRAFDAATGETEWRAEFEGYPNAPTVVGDRVFTTDGRAVYALGAGSGRELWSASPGNRVTTSALVTGGTDDPTVFVGSVETNDSGERTAGHVHALDAADGATRWTTPTPEGNVFGALAARDGVVYGGGTTHSFYALDAETGARRWRADLGDHATAPAVGPESVVVGDDVGTVHALDPADGSVRWTYDAGASVRTSPAVADGTAYVAANDGHLHALDVGTGDRRWRFDGGRRLTCSPTVVGSEDGDDGPTVFVGSQQGNVFAVDAATGERRWSVHLAERVETPPVVVDQRVFVGDGEGRVRAFAAESTSTPDEAGRCRADRTTTRTSETGDADGDGVPDEDDYAPRDASVQRRSDLEAREDGTDDDRGFLAGVAVGTAVAVVGAGSGWWLSNRGNDE